jgi:hypothetical protein
MKLICIDDATDPGTYGVKELTWGKTYEILSFYEKKEDGRQFIKLINDRGHYTDYLIDRFISLAGFRELQLKSLGI